MKMKGKPKAKRARSRSLDCSSITRVACLGHLDLKLTLRLSNEFLLENMLVFNQLETLKDLAFLSERKEVWKEVLLSSNCSSMNFLIQINRAIKKKIFIEYVVLETIGYSDEQKAFKELIEFVTETHFVFLKQTEIVPCRISIVLCLVNGDKVKSFELSQCKPVVEARAKPSISVNEESNVLFGHPQIKSNSNSNVVIEASPQLEEDLPTKEIEAVPQDNINSHDNDNKQSEKDKDKSIEANQSRSPFDKVKEINFNDFNYLYIDLQDYIETELAISVKLNDIRNLIEYLKIHCDIQIIVNYPSISRNCITIDELNAIDQVLLLTDIYLFERKDAYRIFNEIHLFTSKSKSVRDLDRRQEINFFINEICFQCPLQFKLKVGIFMDDFTKLTLVRVAPNAEPLINEFDATIHPKINHHNMRTVEEYRAIITAFYSKYYTIFYGGMIGKLIQKEITDKRIFLAYLSGIESAKKILELDRNGVELPTEKQFYLVKLSIDNINKNIESQTLRKKESKFVLDCVNENKSKLKFYNPLFDFHLNQFFNSRFYRKELKTKGLINSNGFIMYDSVYREMLGSVPKAKKKETFATDALIKLIKDIKVGERVSNKEINTKEIIRQRNSPIERRLPKVSSNLAKYNKFTGANRHLPPLKHKSNSTLYLIELIVEIGSGSLSGTHSNSQSILLKKSAMISPILSEEMKKENETTQQ